MELQACLIAERAHFVERGAKVLTEVALVRLVHVDDSSSPAECRLRAGASVKEFAFPGGRTICVSAKRLQRVNLALGVQAGTDGNEAAWHVG
jgi:hypothetical protein